MGLKSKNKHSRIDFADPSTTRPGSLAKSAVLAALEEDERNKAGSKPERQSRSRCRIDRETVLKINRRMPRRHRSCGDFQWPPINEPHPHVNTNTQRFDNRMLSMKQVAEIRNFFDNYEGYVKELNDTFHYPYISDNMTLSRSTENLKFDQHNVDKMSMLDGENQSSSTPNLCRPISTSLLCHKPLPVLRKCYYLPEEKIHSNKLLEICQHFDKSCNVVDKQESYSTGISNKSIHAVKHDEMSIVVDESEFKQNKITQTKNHSLVVNETDICGCCSRTSLNKYDQKILQSNKALSGESSSNDDKTTMIKFNESPCEPQDKPLVNESSTASTMTQAADIELNKIHLQQQLSALIKYDNAISCGNSGVGDGGNDRFKWKGNPLKQLDAFAVMEKQQNHYHCNDLKAIKSSTETTSWSAMQSYEMEPQMYKHEEQPEEEEIEDVQKQQIRHNSILMNNDCKLHEEQQMQQYTVEQEQTSSDGTCRDKYCKNYQDDGENTATETTSSSSSSSSSATTIVSTYGMKYCNINEISTNKSQINNKNNLNLDLYFDKELSAWMSIDGSVGKWEQQDNENKIDVTNSKTSSDELISHQDEVIGVDTTSDFDSTSDESTVTNCDSKASLIDTQNTIKLSDDVGRTPNTQKGMLFTDGMYIYGPYDFDLFTNEFYQSYDADSSERANDDEATILQSHDNENRIPNIIALKNHDDDDDNKRVDNNLTVADSITESNANNNTNISNNDENEDVRDTDYEILSNISNKDVKVNCSDNDERDLIEWGCSDNDDDADKKYFNYDHRMINNLIDEGTSDISKNDITNLVDHVSHASKSSEMTASNVPFIMQTIAALNNFEKFNYEKNAVVLFGAESMQQQQQQQTRYVLVPLIIKCECSKITSNNIDDEIYSSTIAPTCAYADDDEHRHKQYDDTSNKIRRLNEHKASGVNDNCCTNVRDSMQCDGQHDNSTTIISDMRCAENTKGFNGKDGNEKRNPCSENDLCSLKRNSSKRVAWPPPPESSLYASEPVEYHQEPQQQIQPQYQAISQQQQSQPVQNQQAQIVSQVSTPQQQIYQQPQHPQCYEDTPKQQQQQLPFAGTPLRKEAPITQKPAPVYQSQPVAATFQGGANMRGDTKWPPTEYKMQAEIENEQRRKLALGPAFRPKRVNKDYSRFFAQNALSNTYPGYRVPPGTLHIGNAN